MTLVPPVNVRAEDLGEAVRVLRDAANDQTGPIAVDLGPVTTFMPASPVVYLAVGGPDLDRLARLRQAVVAGPMLRPDHWPWVPHVTLTDDAPAGANRGGPRRSLLLQLRGRLRPGGAARGA